MGAPWRILRDAINSISTADAIGDETNNDSTGGYDSANLTLLEAMRAILKAFGHADGDPVGEATLKPINAQIDSNNSTTSTLGGGATFTGTAVDVSEFAAVLLQVDSDQDSAADGVRIESSTDGTNWDLVHAYSFAAPEGEHLEAELPAQYYRVVYNNGATQQNHFRLQAKLLRNSSGARYQPIDFPINDSSPAAITRTVLTAKNAGGNYANIRSTNGNNLKVSVEEYDPTVNSTYAEDAAHSDGDVGTQIFAVRNDTLASLVDTDGDYTPLQVDAEGAVYVDVATQQARTSAGRQTVGTGTAGVTAVQPQTAGSLASGDIYDLEIVNDSTVEVWLSGDNNGGTEAAQGTPLAPGDSLEKKFRLAVASEDDLFVHVPASGSGDVTLRFDKVG